MCYLSMHRVFKVKLFIWFANCAFFLCIDAAWLIILKPFMNISYMTIMNGMEIIQLKRFVDAIRIIVSAIILIEQFQSFRLYRFRQMQLITYGSTNWIPKLNIIDSDNNRPFSNWPHPETFPISGCSKTIKLIDNKCGGAFCCSTVFVSFSARFFVFVLSFSLLFHSMGWAQPMSIV